jgi:hypothetical protein
MSMHDTLRQVQPGTLARLLAAASPIAPAQAEALVRAAMAEFAWRVETAALSRGGLADLVEALGRVDGAAYVANGRLFLDETPRRDGEETLARLVGTEERRRALAARAASECGADAGEIAAMLPRLAVAAVGDLAQRCNARLASVLAQVPPLGRLSRGSLHVDLAGILRRRCGAGSHSPRALPRAVRRAITGAAASRAFGLAGWYVRFMFGRRVARVLRGMARWSLAPAPVVNLDRRHMLWQAEPPP